jgi:protein SCO1
LERKNEVSQQFKQKKGKVVVTMLILAVTLLACGPSPSTQTRTATTETQAASAKRYPLTGRVVSVDKANQSLTIDGDEIPGFMGAMQMPYAVKDPSILEKVLPSDKIKAEIVVGGDGAYLENVTVTAKQQKPNK